MSPKNLFTDESDVDVKVQRMKIVNNDEEVGRSMVSGWKISVMAWIGGTG